MSFDKAPAESACPTSTAIVSAEALAAPQELIEALSREPDTIQIDTSLYRDLASTGARVGTQSHYAIRITSTATVCVFDKDKNRIGLFNLEPEALERDLLRILKSLAMLSAELRGCLIVHASGVVLPDGRAALFLADSRNGKTTILLEALTKFRTAMLSCDTSILRLEGQDLLARGWPSNFSLSLGTAYDYLPLYSLLSQVDTGLDYATAWRVWDKRVLQTDAVLAALDCGLVPEAKVASVTCLRYDPTGTTGVLPIRSPDHLADWLRRTYLGSRDPLYPNWHRFLEVDDSQICAAINHYSERMFVAGVTAYEMCWAPSPESLLRMVPELEPHCRSKPAV
jgi:hypothetical protein